MRNSSTAIVMDRLRSVWDRMLLDVRELGYRISDALRPRRRCEPDFRDLLRRNNTPRVGRWFVAAAAAASVVVIICGGLWWRLSSGPVSFDIATPWLSAALQERMGGRYRVEVGGTILERDDDGRIAVRLHDVVVRDADNTVVGSAPKAEVGISGVGLLTGNMRAERLSLIGAEMAVRIETDGQLTVFAGSSARPIATADTVAGRGIKSGKIETAPPAAADMQGDDVGLFSTMLAWMQGLDAVGLDGGDLIEIGLKSGSIAVDDRRNGKVLTFANIDLSLTRPQEGGAALAVTSMGTDGPWSVNATITPRGEGRRAIDAVIRDISPKDVLLALRVGSGDIQADVPISAAFRAEIDRNGMPLSLEGRVFAGAGHISDIRDESSRVLIDEAQVELRWDPANHRLIAPIDIHLGPSRLRLTAQIEPPREKGGVWSFGVNEGNVTLASQERRNAAPLVLDRFAIRASYNPSTQLVTLHQGDIRGGAAGVAITGSVDLTGEEAVLAYGVAGTRMPVAAFKRLWPALVATPVRKWVEENVLAGTLERLDIAQRAPVSALRPGSPVHPQESLSIDIVSQATAIRPFVGLPPIRDTEVTVRTNIRTSTVSFGRGTMELPSGKKLSVTNGLFEVPDTKVPEPPARTRFRVEGSAEAVAELLAMDALRESATMPIEPAGVRGNVVANVSVMHPLKRDLPKGAVQYTVDADLTGFSADKFVRGYKAEASSLKVTANQNVLLVKGDMRIASTPVSVEFRKTQGEPDAEIRLQTTLDDGARNRLGIEDGPEFTGPTPVKVFGRTKITERESRLTIEADLTQARVNDFLPGWNKAAGRAARATFVLTDKGPNTRLEDIVLEGGGTQVKGAIELDPQGEIVSAQFPTFSLSDGDKASLKADRNNDGVLKVTIRGDLVDSRGFVKSQFSGKGETKASQPPSDLELDIKLGAVTGHHGEAMRGLDLKFLRRGGQIRTFAMNGKLGRDGAVMGDLRGRGNNRPVVYVESSDAGAFFRFTDVYPRIIGGAMSVAMDAPTADQAAQEGLLNVRDFYVRGEPALESVATSAPAESYDRTGARRSDTATQQSGVGFSRMRVEFSKSPGRLTMREGVVWGPSVGATVDGILDYTRDEVKLRGTFVPAYALNNMFGRIPIVGLFLGGGSNEGLLGVTYQVVGTPTAPVLQVNPMSAVAPGFLRKLFEFRGAGDQTSGRPPEAIR